MALVTRDQRASVVAGSLPFLVIDPLPNGRVDVADQFQIAWLYRGFVAGLPASAERLLRVFEQIRQGSITAQNRIVDIQEQDRIAILRPTEADKV